jgi:hypothetical protein
MKKKTNEDTVFQQDGYLLIDVRFGEKVGTELVKAESFGYAIQKIVNNYVAEHSYDVFDSESEVVFKRLLFTKTD